MIDAARLHGPEVDIHAGDIAKSRLFLQAITSYFGKRFIDIDHPGNVELGERAGSFIVTGLSRPVQHPEIRQRRSPGQNADIGGLNVQRRTTERPVAPGEIGKYPLSFRGSNG